MYINTILTKIQYGTIKKMIKYMVIGDPVSHSRSPGMQNAAFEACGLGSPYGRRHVTPDELPEFVEFARKELAGVNLTVPHKAAVIPLIDRVDPVDQRNHRRLVGDGEVDSGELFPGEFHEFGQFIRSDVPPPVGGAEAARFEGGILHAGGPAVGDRIADYHIFYHLFYRSVLDFG